MPRITQDFHFDAGHRILGHESKCKNLHGHRYKAEVTIQSQILDSLGRVMDFGVIKDIIGKWIDDHWDHNLLLHPNDPIFVEAANQSLEAPTHYLTRICGRLPYSMSSKTNPTAENIAEELFNQIRRLFKEDKLPKDLKCVKVVIHETPNCRAEYPDVNA